jgi:hypothetical protein
LSASRQWTVPDNLPAVMQHAENGYADELEPIDAGSITQAFLDAASISHRLGGGFSIGAVRVERSDGWITVGVVVNYQSFLESLSKDRQQVPKEKDSEPEPSIVDPDPEPARQEPVEA